MRNRPVLILRSFVLITLSLVTALAMPCARAEPIPHGKSVRSITVNEESIELHTYKPPEYNGGPILLVLHGLGRNAPGYRDYAIPLADSHGMLVIAPLFDRKQFPTWRYQGGGLVHDQQAENLEVRPPSQWTGRLFLGIVDAVRSAEQRTDLPYALIGHSAGGQSLSRFAAFMPHTATHIIIANPSTWIWPSREERFPYGFGGLPAGMSGDEALRNYLAQPVTLLLGGADTRRDNNLNLRAGAERQGLNRLERGRNVFKAAQNMAREQGWEFAWRLVEVPGVGHSARRMLGSQQAIDSLGAR